MTCQACGLDKKFRKRLLSEFLSMGYKKDIFGIITYEFELLQF